jgi:predicted acyl esterase
MAASSQVRLAGPVWSFVPARLLVLLLAVGLLLAAAPAPADAAKPRKATSCKTKKAKKTKRCKAIRKCSAARKAKTRKAQDRALARCKKKRKKPVTKPVAAVPAPLAPLADDVPPLRPRRWSPEEWQDTLSEPIYSRVVTTTHYITARDGSQLSLTVHLPEGLPAGQKVPTLMQMTPYRPLDQVPGALDDYLFFVERGAAYVEADERGTGGSEGCLDFGGSADRSDAQVFAEWIRSQPWSDGKIVTDGVSHPGMGSVVAHAAIPGLTGAIAVAPVVSYYQDEWLQGAKFEDQFNGPAYEGIEMAPPLPPEFADPNALKAQAATCRGQTTLDFTPVDGPFTELWQDRDLSRHLPADRKPILLAHGFVDVNVHTDHSQMYWDALPDDYPKYGVFGWWAHEYPDMDATNYRMLRHRWMDALLFGRDNGLEAEPRVLVEDSRGEWHEGRDWPLEQSEHVTLHPAGDGGLRQAAPAPATAEYADEPGAVRGSWEGASVAFRSEPLAEDRLVNGAPEVDLLAASSADQTKWVAYLMEEFPDGTRERVSHGYADSHTWKSADTWTALTPGQPQRWTLKLIPTAVVVEKGNRLVLVVTSQDSRRSQGAPCFHQDQDLCYSSSGILPATTMGRATNTVHLGPGGTAVRIAWANPAHTQRAPFPQPA